MSVTRSAGLALFLAVLLAGPTVAGEPPFSVSLPGWRMQARPYPAWNDMSVGVYRRLSEHWDAGLQLASNFRSQDLELDHWATEDNGVAMEVRDSHEFDLTGYLEFRRWTPFRSGLAAFVGPQIAVGHHTGWWVESSENLPYQGESYRELAEYSIGMGPVLGADLRLLSHLSISMSVRPLFVAYGWGTSHETAWSVEDPLQPARTSESTTKQDSFSVDTTLLPQAYLTVTF